VKLRAVFATARHERERLWLLPEHADPVAPRSELAATFEQVDDGHGSMGKFLDALTLIALPGLDPGIDRAIQ